MFKLGLLIIWANLRQELQLSWAQAAWFFISLTFSVLFLTFAWFTYNYTIFTILIIPSSLLLNSGSIRLSSRAQKNVLTRLFISHFGKPYQIILFLIHLHVWDPFYLLNYFIYSCHAHLSSDCYQLMRSLWHLIDISHFWWFEWHL